ncbi:MAG: lysophospholipid acyltransferase family protein, partial [Bacteroidota bacterium]|nr:lysophospholipid acyltransferase family protein [Bacteroidota bacterium]
RLEGTDDQPPPMNIAGWMLAPLKTVLAILHTALCSITGLIAMALNAHNGDWVMWQVGRQMWSRPLLQVILGAKLDINVHPEAQALADQQQGVVLVANHTSLLDINAAFAASPTPIVFLSKASVRKVPLLGKLNELAGTVFVERGNRASSDKAVHQLTDTLKQGRSVLVFPEGTRSEDGNLRPFKKGAFHLAKAAEAPIVPMHISGTWERLRSGAWLIGPSRSAVRVRVGAPLQHTKEDDPATLMRRAAHAVAGLQSD